MMDEVPDPPYLVKPAGLWVRYWAGIIDSIILSIPTILFILILSFSVGLPISSPENSKEFLDDKPFLVWPILVLCLAYPVYFIVKYGATIGKQAYGLIIVDNKTRRNVSVRKALVRESVKLGIFLIPIFGSLVQIVNGLMIAFSKEKLGIHDLIAGTRVVKEREVWAMSKQIGCAGIIIVSFVVTFLIWSLITQFSSK